jgi:hypothetical protein
MILRHSEILAHSAAGKSNQWIAKNCGPGGDQIRQVRATLNPERNQIFVLQRTIS